MGRRKAELPRRRAVARARPRVAFHDDSTRIDWAELARLLAAAGLGERDPGFTGRAFTGSYARCFAVAEDDDNRAMLIGAARAISDGVSVSAIYDVAVLPSHQGESVGRGLMEGLLARLPARQILLVSAPAQIGFYERLGFRRLQTAMARLAEPQRWEKLGYFLAEDCTDETG